MCDARRAPEHGADSAEAYVLRPFLVDMRDDDGDRIRVRVPLAMGRHDAYSQAREYHPGYVPLNAEQELVEASLDQQDAEHDRAVQA